MFDPVGEGVFTVLDDPVEEVSGWLGLGSNLCKVNLRFAGLITIVSFTGLARGDRGVVNQLEEMFAEAGDDGEFLAVLAKGIELVGEG